MRDISNEGDTDSRGEHRHDNHQIYSNKAADCSISYIFTPPFSCCTVDTEGADERNATLNFLNISTVKSRRHFSLPGCLVDCARKLASIRTIYCVKKFEFV
jgi:hypothetical protein